MFKPNTSKFITPITVLRRQETIVNGMVQITYPSNTTTEHLCAFKAFYGQEAIYAGQAGIKTGGTITTWYDPTIKYRDRVSLGGQMYEIITPPENVEQRNMFMVFKVSKVVTHED